MDDCYENADVGASAQAEQNNISNKNNRDQLFSQDIPNLLQRHFDNHVKGSGICGEVAKERGYRTVLGKKELEDLGFSTSQRRTPGLLLPVHTSDGKQPFCQYRPDSPRQNAQGKPVKYEAPANMGMRIDVPPRCRELLKNPNIRLWVTEGIKKADALASRGECVIALLGVWNFKGKNEFGGTTLLADFDYIAWKDREVYIVYDNDLITKTQVRLALDRLTEHLKRKGAHVFHIYLPQLQGEKIGVDDYLLSQTIEELLSLARTPKNKEIEVKRPKPILTARFEGLIDIVEHEGKPYFLFLRDGKAIIEAEIKTQEGLFIPPPREKLPWLLPRANKVREYYETDDPKRLFAKLEEYHRSISEFPNESYYTLLAAWDFHTYIMEAWDYSPILLFYAVPERGKSRTGKGIAYVAYRGRHTETLREASIFRASGTQGATLFFDVRDIWKKLERQGSEDILLLRFEKGAKAERVLYPERGPFQDTVYFELFGPTAIATNEPIHRILDTRCIPIVMPQSNRNFPLDPRPQFGLPFRERLTAWRAKMLLKEIELKDKPAPGRLGDILRPLATIINLVVPETMSEFMDLVARLQEERLQEKSISIEAEVVQAVAELESEVEHGTLAISAIVEKVNFAKSEKEEITPQRIGKLIRSLGFHPAKQHDNVKAIFYNSQQVKDLQIAWGLVPLSENTSPKSPSSPRTLEEMENINPNGELGDSGDNGDMFSTIGTEEDKSEKRGDPWD